MYHISDSVEVQIRGHSLFQRRHRLKDTLPACADFRSLGNKSRSVEHRPALVSDNRHRIFMHFLKKLLDSLVLEKKLRFSTCLDEGSLRCMKCRGVTQRSRALFLFAGTPRREHLVKIQRTAIDVKAAIIQIQSEFFAACPRRKSGKADRDHRQHESNRRKKVWVVWCHCRTVSNPKRECELADVGDRKRPSLRLCVFE
jgi:hypothetical protein